jgi:disulfide bond formation protein DsbB
MGALSQILTGWRWPVAAIVLSALMLAAAHGFERFGNLAPCPLCLRQREVYWALIAMGLTGLLWWRIVPKRRFLVALNVMIGLVFGVGLIVAAYHAGVEWQIFPPPAACSAGEAFDPMIITDLSAPLMLPACNDAPFYWLGLSMAGWNGVVSAGLAMLSFAAAGLTFRTYRSA